MPEYDAIMMSLVIFVPTAFALVLMVIPRLTDEFIRWWSLFGTAVTLVLSICMFISFFDRVVQANIYDTPKTLLNLRVDKANDQERETGARDSQDWVARYPWIERFNINYFLGADGIRMALVLLTTGLSFLAMIASWNISRYVRGYCILFLILETGMIGTFLALDFFLFYIFWEVMLLPMYFLIGVWGGPRREYAAIKFFLYTLFGSVFILIALLACYFTDVKYFAEPDQVKTLLNAQTRPAGIDKAEAFKKFEYHTFDLVVLQRVGKAALQVLNGDQDAVVAEVRKRYPEAAPADLYNEQGTGALQQAFFSPTFQYVMFLFLFVGFAIKVPVFPFHTWLPDAHVEAPTPISMILAGEIGRASCR